MTSANVIEYTIFKDGMEVGKHRQHLLCKLRHHELLKFDPPEQFEIMSWGYDEDEEYWEDKKQNLKEMLIKFRIIK